MHVFHVALLPNPKITFLVSKDNRNLFLCEISLISIFIDYDFKDTIIVKACFIGSPTYFQMKALINNY